MVLTNNVHLAAHTFGNEGRKPFATAVRRKVVDRDGLPIYIAQFVQALEEPVKSSRPRRTWIEHEIKKAESWEILGRLRVHSKRPDGSRATEQGDELASLHLTELHLPPLTRLTA